MAECQHLGYCEHVISPKRVRIASSRRRWPKRGDEMTNGHLATGGRTGSAIVVFRRAEARAYSGDIERNVINLARHIDMRQGEFQEISLRQVAASCHYADNMIDRGAQAHGRRVVLADAN